MNNNFGYIPKCVLSINEIEGKLDSINEFILEESEKYKNDYFRKNGKTEPKFYSSIRYREYPSKAPIRDVIQRQLASGSITEYSIPAHKGMYIYHALEECTPSLGFDYPVGFNGHLGVGDYFKFLSPEVPPVISATGDLVKSVFEKENGLEEAVFRRTDHWFLAAGRSRCADQRLMR